MHYSFGKQEGALLHNTFIIFLLLACLIEPDGITDGSHYGVAIFQPLHTLYVYSKYISFVISFYLVLNLRKPSLLFVLILIYHSIIIISSIINGNMTKGMLLVESRIISISIIAEYYMQKTPVQFIKSLVWLLLIFVALNFVSLILFPNGMYTDSRWWTNNYFLGYKNLHIYYFLPCIFCASLYSYIRQENRIFIYLLLGLLLVSCLLNHSTTSLIAIGLLTIASIFFVKLGFPKWMNANLVFLTGFVVSVVMITMTVEGTFGQYTELIAENFDKDSDTMSSRGVIWTESLIYFWQHPLFGNGDLIFDIGWAWDVTQVHNNYLDMAVVGGVSLLLVFSTQVFILSRRMRKINIQEVYNVILFILIAYAVEFLSEARRNNYLWFPLMIIIFYTPNLINLVTYKAQIKEIHKNRTK